MKIVQKKCPSCGGKLDLTPGELEGTCPYCGNDFVIDDDVIEVKVQVKDDYDLEIAITTLDKFKEYDKAGILFRRLLSRYGHDKNIYLYLVRALTYDFTRKELYTYEVTEINNYWEKYKTLCSKKELKLYEDKVREFNYSFWKSELNNITNKFDEKITKVNLKKLESIWENFCLYVTLEKREKYEIKYNKFKKNIEEHNKKRKIINVTILCTILVLILLFLSFLLTEKPKLKLDKINYSIYVNYKENIFSEEDFSKKIFKNYNNITIKSTNITDDKLYINFDFENLLKKNEYTFTLYLVDDYGPVFKLNDCVFKDTEEVDLNKCLTVSDLSTDMKQEDISFNTKDSNFKIPGEYLISATAMDKDENITNVDFNVSIIKSDLIVDVNLKKNELIEGDSTKLSYSIKPNVYNKKVKIEYDNSIISIDKDLNVKALKRGTTDICVIPEYDETKKVCERINVKLKCKNSYTFKFDGSKEEKLVMGVDMCPGTYRICTSVLSRKDAYHLTYTPASGSGTKFYTIWKSASSLSDEGSKISLGEGGTLKIPTGVTKITLK